MCRFGTALCGGAVMIFCRRVLCSEAFAVLRKLDLALIGGAIGALVASIIWLSVNYVSMLRINSIKVVAHGYFDVHILLHLGLIAVMIWLEWMVGVFILRHTFTAQFAALFQRSRV